MNLGSQVVDSSMLSLQLTQSFLSVVGVVGMFRIGSITVLATTLNVVGAVEDEEDNAPELFLPLRVAIRRDSSSASDMYLARP